jgi:AraC-like DNA-binding protein
MRSLTLLDAFLDTGSSLTIGLFWLFSRAWFDDISRLGWRSWAALAAPTTMVALLDFHLIGKTPDLMSIWFPMLLIIWFSFAIAGLWIAWRGRRDDLVEARRRLRLRLVGAVGGLSLLVNAVEVGVYRFGVSTAWRSVVEGGILIATGLLCAAMFAHRQADLFGSITLAEARTQNLDTDAPLAALAERLLVHMRANYAWRDETMTISNLAAQLGEQEYRVRRAINGQLGHRNFAAFLNGYRLAEVKAALIDPTQRDVPILTIALDAGFGSLGPFNRAFREAEGITPSEYRQQAA